MPTVALDPASNAYPAGYHLGAASLTAVDADLIPANIGYGTTIFGVLGTLVQWVYNLVMPALSLVAPTISVAAAEADAGDGGQTNTHALTVVAPTIANSTVQATISACGGGVAHKQTGPVDTDETAYTNQDLANSYEIFIVNAGASVEYNYQQLTNLSNYVIQSGDYVEYDIYWTAAGSHIVPDFDTTTNYTFRDHGAVDQNGLSAHPATDISAYANGQWYHRKFALASAYFGLTVNRWLIANEAGTPNSTLTGWIKNMRITDGAGTVRRIVFTGFETGWTFSTYSSQNSTFVSFSPSVLANMDLLPATGNATGDGFYFGFANLWDALYLYVGQAGAGSYNITWKYWNGAWVALTMLNDDSLLFKTTGQFHVTFARPSDWQLLTIASIANLYWIKAEVTMGTMTTQPKGTMARVLNY